MKGRTYYKKSILFPSLLLALSLAACANSESTQPETTPETTETVEQPAETPATPAETPSEEASTLSIMPDDFDEGAYDIFEEAFYGVWTDDHGTFSLTYQNSQSGEYPLGFAEDEENWYMHVFGGGAGQFYWIHKDEPDTMYYFTDWDGMTPINEETYWSVYTRSEEIPDEEKVLTVGEISSFGMRKLKADYGYLLCNYMESVTLEDGSVWMSNSAMAYPKEVYYLVELPTEEKITYIRQFYPAEIIDDEEKLLQTERTNIQLVAEKQNGEWVITSAEKAE